jgi:hypothetical protein
MVRIHLPPAESLRTLSSSTPATLFRWSPTRKRGHEAVPRRCARARGHLEQRNLLVGERVDLLAINRDSSTSPSWACENRGLENGEFQGGL